MMNTLKLWKPFIGREVYYVCNNQVHNMVIKSIDGEMIGLRGNSSFINQLYTKPLSEIFRTRKLAIRLGIKRTLNKMVED